MAIRPLNSIAGFSTGDPALTIIQANGDVSTINFTANGISNVGNVGNLKILGGSNGQFLQTDGAGNLVWDNVGNLSSNRAAPMPYLIPTGEAFIVNENFQGLYTQPITIDGELTVDGILIEIQDSIQSSPTQVLFDTNGTATGNTGFTFLAYNGNLNVPGNINVTGSVIPSVDDIYDLGSNVKRWGNGYFGGNTVYIGDASISIDANGFVVITNEVGGSFTVEGTSPSDTSEIENGTSNVKVLANGNVTFNIAGVANVMQVTSAGANLTGNLTTGGIKTDNLYYANGTAWDLSNPGGSNTQIQFNSNGEFGASANFAFDTATNNLNLNANLVVSNGTITSSGNITAPYFLGNVQGNISGNIVVPGNNTAVIFNDSGNAGASDAFTFNKSSNLVTANSLSVTNDATVSGNLSVNGNLIYINVTELSIKDPIINLQTGANGAPPSSNSGKDVGSALNYYDTEARVAFMGWDTSNAEFAFGSQTTISSEIVTFNTLGNVRAQTFKGNVESVSISATTIAGNLTTATQSNITTVGTLGSLAVSGNISAGNINGGNLLNANYLVANSGCVTIGSSVIAVGSNTGGIFNTNVDEINLGLVANITLGSTTGNVTARGNLIANNISTLGNITANLITGTLTTSSQANITTVGTLGNLNVGGNTVTNIANANTLLTQSIVTKRAGIPATVLTVVDSFSASSYRTAKYVVSSQNDDGYESLEVLLIHNNINSYITVYAAINDGGGNTVTFSTGINSGNVELRATGLAGNTVINLIGTYVPN